MAKNVVSVIEAATPAVLVIIHKRTTTKKGQLQKNQRSINDRLCTLRHRLQRTAQSTIMRYDITILLFHQTKWIKIGKFTLPLSLSFSLMWLTSRVSPNVGLNAQCISHRHDTSKGWPIAQCQWFIMRVCI